jgi:hypothetical protein
MGKLKSFILIFGLCISPLIGKSEALLVPDTVYISPAYYNPKFEDIGSATLFNLKVNNPTGVEIISTETYFDLNPDYPEDKTIINAIPVFVVQETGSIVLEDKSLVAMKASVYFKNPQLFQYENKIYINYKTKEDGFVSDTVQVIANRVDKELFTKNQVLLRDICEGSNMPELFNIYSTLLNGTNGAIRLDSVKYRTSNQYSVVGYSNKAFDYDVPPNPNIELPYTFNDPYFTVILDVTDFAKKNNSVYVDYYTDKGLFTDTISIEYSMKKGITAKSPYQRLTSIDYSKVESKPLAIRLCSEEGYRVKSIRLEGEIDNGEIDLEEFVKVGEVIDTTFAELSKFVITPKEILVERTGAYIYELENVATGNIINVDFPFVLKIERNTDVAEDYERGTLVYPNPAESVVNISERIKVDKAELINPLGSTVVTVENSNTINVDKISKGIYFLVIESQKKQIVEKIIIQ